MTAEVKGPVYGSAYILKMFDGEEREIYYVVPPPIKQKVLEKSTRRFEIDPYKALEISASTKEGGRPLLYIFPTRGDGACAIHVLLGNPIKAKATYECQSVEGEKKAFCDHLRALRAQGSLPEGIQTLLEDFFLHFQHAPTKFRNQIAAIHQKLYSGYATLTPAEQEQRKEAFSNNNEVFEAYLRAFSDRGYYLFQTELIEVAKFKNLALCLWQTGWGDSRGELTSMTFNEGKGRERLEIYFEAPGHYSRAVRF